MKKFIMIFISFVLLLILLTGCGSKPTGVPVHGDGNGNQGITVNKIPFTTVQWNELTKVEQQNINNWTKQRGYRVFDKTTPGGRDLILLASGSKPTTGYDIQVESVEDNEGKTIIVVKETAPDKGSLQAQHITYPYTVIEFQQQVSPNFVVQLDNGGTLPKMSGLHGTVTFLSEDNEEVKYEKGVESTL